MIHDPRFNINDNNIMLSMFLVDSICSNNLNDKITPMYCTAAICGDYCWKLYFHFEIHTGCDKLVCIHRYM